MIEKRKIEKEQKQGTLFLVSTPIGNHEDITLRAQKVLKNCHKIICEEEKVAARLLKKYNISKEFELVNEQNEAEMTPEIIQMLQSGMDMALISDCGTPVFADPGHELVKAAMLRNINVEVVPGVSSIMTALVRSGLDITSFIYAGFLPRGKDERYDAIRLLLEETRTVVLLETPYRLMPVLEAASKLMPERQVYIGCNLTMPFETHHYGTFEELNTKFATLDFKGEFVICFSGNTFRKMNKRVTTETEGGFARPPRRTGDSEYSGPRRTGEGDHKGAPPERRPSRGAVDNRSGSSYSRPDSRTDSRGTYSPRPHRDYDNKSTGYDSRPPRRDDFSSAPGSRDNRGYSADRTPREGGYGSDRPRTGYAGDKPRSDSRSGYAGDKPREVSGNREGANHGSAFRSNDRRESTGRKRVEGGTSYEKRKAPYAGGASTTGTRGKFSKGKSDIKPRRKY